MKFQRPRPVLTSAGVAGAITSVVGVLSFLGYDEAAAHLSTESTAITSAVIAVISVGSHALSALHAQGQVTPLAAPQDLDGTPLVRSDVITNALAAAPDITAPPAGPEEVPTMESVPEMPAPTSATVV